MSFESEHIIIIWLYIRKSETQLMLLKIVFQLHILLFMASYHKGLEVCLGFLTGAELLQSFCCHDGQL